MTTCDVLRCERPSAGRVTVSKDGPEYPFMEAAVCAEHKLAIEAGETWDFGDDSAILMGDDISLTLIGWSLEPTGAPGATLTIEAGSLGSESKSMTFWLAPDQLVKLGEQLSTSVD